MTLLCSIFIKIEEKIMYYVIFHNEFSIVTWVLEFFLLGIFFNFSLDYDKLFLNFKLKKK